MSDELKRTKEIIDKFIYFFDVGRQNQKKTFNFIFHWKNVNHVESRLHTYRSDP